MYSRLLPRSPAPLLALLAGLALLLPALLRPSAAADDRPAPAPAPGATAAPPSPDAPVLRWKQEFWTGVTASPLAVDLAGDARLEVVIGGGDSALHCLDADGRELWRVATGGVVQSSPALCRPPGRPPFVVAGCEDGKLYAVDAAGSKLWTFAAGAEIYSSPAVADAATGPILVGCADGNLYCVSFTGAELWRFATGAPVHTSCAVGDADGDGSPEVIFGSHNQLIYGVSLTGKELWRFRSTYEVNSSPVLCDADGKPGLEILCGGDTELYLLEGNGQLREVFSTDRLIMSSPVPAERRGERALDFFVPGVDGQLYCFGAGGALRWKERVPNRVLSVPVVLERKTGEVEYVLGCTDGRLYAWDGAGERRWSVATGCSSVVSSPAVADLDGDGRLELLVGGNEGEAQRGAFYCYSLSGAYRRARWPRFHGDERNSGCFVR
ncbi:MAG: PQQ-binding-like beta-propeller repeat protein [Planctomycetes bacterium]|nr:PQQ-binding-like beta-propeller repeat protein [Planctomycetota bacterium]